MLTRPEHVGRFARRQGGESEAALRATDVNVANVRVTNVRVTNVD